MVFEKFKRGEADFIPRVDDLEKPRWQERDLLSSRGIKARITLPLFAEDILIGSMGFHAMQSEPDWADYTVDLLIIVGEIYLNLRQRKHIEQQLHFQANLLQDVGDIIVSTDLNMAITSWNKKAEMTYGYSADRVMGKRLNNIIRAEYPDVSRKDIFRLFMANQQWQGEIRHYDKDGQALDLWLSLSGITDASGELTGAVYVYHNLKQRKEAEKHKLEVEIQKGRIEMLEQIIGDLSHDIKTPLASIQLLMYMLGKNKDIAKQAEYLERMARQIERLTRLVDDILTMSRLDKGEELQFGRVNLNSVLQDLTESLDDILASKNQTLTLDFAPDIPLIRGNETELNRAFANLIENAINYSDEGKPLYIQTRLDDASISLEIRDEGDGISPDDLVHIFERFYRADKARNTARGGTGLGLAIVKRIVELHQAEIEVQSQLDRGTSFRICFPLP